MANYEVWKDIKGYECFYKISRVCRGERKTAGGYKWKFI